MRSNRLFRTVAAIGLVAASAFVVAGTGPAYADPNLPEALSADVHRSLAAMDKVDPVEDPGLYARESADVRGSGNWSVGIFNPLRYGVTETIEIEAHPLVFFSAPHATARVRHLDGGKGGWRLTGEYGAGLTVMAWSMAAPLGVAGDLVPSCKVTESAGKESNCDQPGKVLVPSLGLAVSKGMLDAAGAEGSTVTLRMDIAKGFAVSGKTVLPLAAWAPADVQMAPWLGQMRSRFRAGYDRAMTSNLRVRTEAGLYHVTQADDDDRSPWAGSLHAGLDYRVGNSSRFTVGAIYWNSDMHEIVTSEGAGGFAKVERVRSHEVWPTIDFIWSN